MCCVRGCWGQGRWLLGADSHLSPVQGQLLTAGCVPSLQAALQAAAAAGLDTSGDEHRWEGPAAADALAGDLVYDPATRMFWRNVRARVSGQGWQSAGWPCEPFGACWLARGGRGPAHVSPGTPLLAPRRRGAALLALTRLCHPVPPCRLPPRARRPRHMPCAALRAATARLALAPAWQRRSTRP